MAELSDICKVEVKKYKSFQKNLDAAQQKIRENTGYDGSFEAGKREEFFSSYEVMPVSVPRYVGKPVGVMVEYALRQTQEEKQERCEDTEAKPVSGCAKPGEYFTL